MDRLTEAELATMRAEHQDDGGACDTCWGWNEQLDAARAVDWPCAAARLLEHFAPGPVPHLAGIAAGLFGPVCSEELRVMSRPWSTQPITGAQHDAWMAEELPR